MARRRARVVSLRRAAVSRASRDGLDDRGRVAKDGTVGDRGGGGPDTAVRGRAGRRDAVGRRGTFVEDGAVGVRGNHLGIAVRPRGRGSARVRGTNDLGVGGVEGARGTGGDRSALLELGADSSGSEEKSLRDDKGGVSRRSRGEEKGGEGTYGVADDSARDLLLVLERQAEEISVARYAGGASIVDGRAGGEGGGSLFARESRVSVSITASETAKRDERPRIRTWTLRRRWCNRWIPCSRQCSPGRRQQPC